MADALGTWLPLGADALGMGAPTAGPRGGRSVCAFTPGCGRSSRSCRLGRCDTGTCGRRCCCTFVRTRPDAGPWPRSRALTSALAVSGHPSLSLPRAWASLLLGKLQDTGQPAAPVRSSQPHARKPETFSEVWQESAAGLPGLRVFLVETLSAGDSGAARAQPLSPQTPPVPSGRDGSGWANSPASSWVGFVRHPGLGKAEAAEFPGQGPRRCPVAGAVLGRGRAGPLPAGRCAELDLGPVSPWPGQSRSLGSSSGEMAC